MSSRTHTVIATLLVIFGFYILRISKVELQPGSEAQIANSADVLIHGAPNAEQILVSPFPSFVTSLSVTILKHSLVSVRIGTIVCGVLCMLLVYVLGKRFLSYNGSIIAMAVCGTQLYWVGAVRQTELLIWCSTTFLLLLQMCEMLQRVPQRATHKLWLHTAFITVATVLALLCAPWMLLPVVLCWGTVIFLHPVYRIRTSIGVLGGFCIALPWYLGLLLTGKNLTEMLGVHYGVNGLQTPMQNSLELFVTPFAVCGVAYCLLIYVDKNILPNYKIQPLITTLIVLFLVGIISTITPFVTMYQMVVFASPITALIGVYAIEKTQRAQKTWVLLSILCSTVISCICALIQQVQPELLDTIPTVVLAVVVFVFSVGIAFLLKNSASRIAVSLLKPVLYSAIGVGALGSAATLVIQSKESKKHLKLGAQEVAEKIEEESEVVKKFAFVYHDNPAGVPSEQLDWNLRGWMSGLRKGYVANNYTLPAGDISSTTILDAKGASWVVYYNDGNAGNRKTVKRILGREYSEIVESPNYVLYRLK